MIENETTAINLSRPVPVFPLEDCVLLPHTVLPLHVFEPRYRQMANKVLDSYGLIAMGLFDGEVDEDQYLHGHPAVRPYVCVGRVVNYQRLDDGRYLIVLQGVIRARIAEELPHEPYRVMLLDSVEDQEDDTRTTLVRARIDQLLRRSWMQKVRGVAEVADCIDDDVPSGTAIDILTGLLAHTPDQRYEMLSEPDVPARGEWVVERLTELLKAETN